jgi:hypothetical protein
MGVLLQVSTVVLGGIIHGNILHLLGDCVGILGAKTWRAHHLWRFGRTMGSADPWIGPTWACPMPPPSGRRLETLHKRWAKTSPMMVRVT